MAVTSKLDDKLKAELKQIKFTADELESLQKLQNSYTEKQAMFGQLSVQRILLKQQMDAIEARQTEVELEYETVQLEERELVQKLDKVYGPGTLDPQTGIFTPAK